MRTCFFYMVEKPRGVVVVVLILCTHFYGCFHQATSQMSVYTSAFLWVCKLTESIPYQFNIPKPQILETWYLS